MKKQQRKTPTVKRMVVKLGKTQESNYEINDLVNILENVSFDLINVNLSTKKSNLGLSGAGYSSVGFVNGFNTEDNTFDVVIFENKIADIEKLGEVVITARVFNNKDGIITKITGLDISSAE